MMLALVVVSYRKLSPGIDVILGITMVLPLLSPLASKTACMYQEFCYDYESAGLTSKAVIPAVDKLDFVFVDGDNRLLPWHFRTRKVSLTFFLAISV